MRFIRSIHILCFVAGTLLSACASSPLRSSGQVLETELDHADVWAMRCSTGINMRQDGKILYLSNRAQNAGLRRGDRIVTVDSKPFEDKTAYVGLIKQLEPGDTVHLSIERQGGSRQIDVECHDDSNINAMNRQLVQAMEDGDSAGCLHVLSDMNGELPVSGVLSWASYHCRFDGRSGRAKSDDLEAGYTLWRIKLEEATTNSAALEAIKPHVLQVIQWLQAGGSRGMAEELDYKLALAERTTYGASDAASGDNGQDPAPPDQPQQAPPNGGSGFAASGTGFAVTPDGTVLTCAHVVKGASNITVTTADGIQHKAHVLALNYNADLALLRFEGATPNYLALAPSADAALGDKLFTIGFPVPELLGLSPKYNEGALASLSGGNDDPRFIQMSVPIQPGNSGGPVVNTRGRVVGIVDSTLDPSFFLHNTEGQLPQGINYAVKAEFAKTLLKDNGITPVAPNPGPSVTEAVRKAIVFILVTGP